MSTTAPGYDVPAWADIPTITAAALRVLNLPPGDSDAGAVQAAAGVAATLVAGYLGTPDPPWPDPAVAPSPVTEAIVLVTVEVYRRKDATFGVLNTWSTADFGPVRVSTDWLKAVEAMLHPYMRDSYGIG